jgi:uncharacterized protein (TIGR03000 family)
MYSIVLVVTLGSGGDVTAWQEDRGRPALHTEHLHQADRFRRGGCYGGGCYGGCWGGGCYGGYSCCGCGGGMPYAVPSGQMGSPQMMPAPARRSSYYGQPGVDGLPPTGVGTPRRDDRNLDRDLNAPQDRRLPAPNIERRKSDGTDGQQTDRPPQEAKTAASATVLVSLPADAKLTIDDTPTRSTTARRRFESPPLEPGKTYHYTLTAEAMREGRAVTVSQRIDVRAGQETRVQLVLPNAAVARR